MTRVAALQANSLASPTVTNAGLVAGNERKSLKAAQEFEAVLLTSVFQKMQDQVSSLPGEEHASATLGELGVQQLSSALSAAGGIGLARLILPYLRTPHPSDLPT